MKPVIFLPNFQTSYPFSALGRAVWDETPLHNHRVLAVVDTFSALGRAVWDETFK